MKASWKPLSLLVLILALSQAAFAQASPYSLQDCFKAALKQSEILAGQNEIINQSEAHFSQALAQVLPSITASYSFANIDLTGIPTTASTFISTQQGQTTAKVSATMPLFRGFRDFAALGETQNLIASQKESYRAAARQLYMDTANAYHLVLSLEKDISLQMTEQDLYRKRILELNHRIAIGRSRQTDVLTLQTTLSQLIAQTEQTKSELSTARELLAFLTGQPSSLLLQDDQNPQDQAGSLEAYISTMDTRPDVKSAKENVSALENNVTIARGALLPSADVGGNYYLARPTGIYQNSRWDYTLSASLPLFTGGFNLSKLGEAQSQLRQGKFVLEGLKRQAAQQLRTAFQQVQSDFVQVDALTKAVDIAQQNQRIVLQDYDNGLVTILDVLMAINLQQEAARNLNKANYNLRTDYQNFQTLVGNNDTF